MVTIDDQPWFVAKDVLLVLGMDPNQSQNYLSRLDAGEKQVVSRSNNHVNAPDLFQGSASKVSLISESGLYKLIMRSDKPQAKPFQDYVTKEILPSIRKTGAFVTGQPSLQENPQMDPLDLMLAQAQTKTTSVSHHTTELMSAFLIHIEYALSIPKRSSI